MKETGGPAYPNSGDNTPDNKIYDGMTLRDYFAGQVLVSYGKAKNLEITYERIAFECYQYADAMIKERIK